MATTQVRGDRRVELALESLEGFALNPNFTTRKGYGVRCPGQPSETEPLQNDSHPEQAQIYRSIMGPGNAMYGTVQSDGTITLEVMELFRSTKKIDVAAVVEGYGRLKIYLSGGEFKVDPDKAFEKGFGLCAMYMGYERRDTSLL